MRSDELDYQRAVQAYLLAVPMVNAIEFWRALVDAGVSPTEPSLLVFDRPLTPAPADPGAGTQMLYAFTLLDLAQTGPIVAEMPPGFRGHFWDFRHRGLEERAGAFADGRTVVLLGPGQDAAAPPGAVVVRSRTNRIFGGGRCCLKAGDSADAFIDLVAGIKLYPLARGERTAPMRIVLNRDRPFVQSWPKNISYFSTIADELSVESGDGEDGVMHAMLAPLGIARGKPFALDDRMRRILNAAAVMGAAMATTTGFAARLHGRQLWSDRQWERNFFPTTSKAAAGGGGAAARPAQGWYQVVGDGRYVFASTLRAGDAQWFSSTFHDRDGSAFDGSQNYRFRMKAGGPPKLSWSMTLYDNQSCDVLDADRRRPGAATPASLQANDDGSVDLWFAPQAPRNTKDNWIRTIPGQAFFATFRLYGPLDLVMDESWKLNDVERVG